MKPFFAQVLAMSLTVSEDSAGIRKLGQNLAAVRAFRGLSQQELASLCGLSQVQISYFETGKRWPTLPQLTKLVEVLEIPFAELLAGRDCSDIDLEDIALELRNLGIVDLRISNARVPGAFHPAEQVISLALAGDEPEPRIVEAIPAVLAWNVWNLYLLRAYGHTYDRRVAARLAWLADVALTIDKGEGFPGGIVNKRQLSRFLKMVKRPQTPDSLGRPAGDGPLSPVWKRWNVTYTGNLATFRERAAHLHDLKAKRRFWRGSGRLSGSPLRVRRARR
jgi:transcriptional regulator with XRE-family HTH domain